MPKANKKNLMLDRPTSHGGWPRGPSRGWSDDKPVSDIIYDYLMDMGLIEESLLRNTISEIILSQNRSNLINECIVAAGQTQNQHVLTKTRDRNYKPVIKIIRDLTSEGTEVVYMIDLKTGFLEGINSHGVGILNSTLMVYEDENPEESGTQKSYGDIIKKALNTNSAEDALKIINSTPQGIEGHTFVGCPKEIYSIECTSHHPAVVEKLDPYTGFDVRTNHGHTYSDAGYNKEHKPEDYESSVIRKKTAETCLSGIEDYSNLARSILTRKYPKESNNNTFRRTSNLRTTSQVTMNLPKKEFLFYMFPGECIYQGLIDKTPEDYSPKINVKIFKWREN